MRHGGEQRFEKLPHILGSPESPGLGAHLNEKAPGSDFWLTFRLCKLEGKAKTGLLNCVLNVEGVAQHTDRAHLQRQRDF